MAEEARTGSYGVQETIASDSPEVPDIELTFRDEIWAWPCKGYTYAFPARAEVTKLKKK